MSLLKTLFLFQQYEQKCMSLAITVNSIVYMIDVALMKCSFLLFLHRHMQSVCHIISLHDLSLKANERATLCKEKLSIGLTECASASFLWWHQTQTAGHCIGHSWGCCALPCPSTY